MYIAHGGCDAFIPPKWGVTTKERFVQDGGIPTIHFTLVPTLQHDMTTDELVDVLAFFRTNMHDHNTNDEDAGRHEACEQIIIQTNK